MTRTHCRALPPDGWSLAGLVHAASGWPTRQPRARTELVTVFPHRMEYGVSVERIRGPGSASGRATATFADARLAAALRRKT